MPRWRADKQNLGLMAVDQFAGHGQRGDDMAAGASPGDENAQLGQAGSLSD